MLRRDAGGDPMYYTPEHREKRSIVSPEEALESFLELERLVTEQPEEKSSEGEGAGAHENLGTAPSKNTSPRLEEIDSLEELTRKNQYWRNTISRYLTKAEVPSVEQTAEDIVQEGYVHMIRRLQENKEAIENMQQFFYMTILNLARTKVAHSKMKRTRRIKEELRHYRDTKVEKHDKETDIEYMNQLNRVVDYLTSDEAAEQLVGRGKTGKKIGNLQRAMLKSLELYLIGDVSLETLARHPDTEEYFKEYDLSDKRDRQLAGNKRDAWISRLRKKIKELIEEDVMNRVYS